MFKVSNGLRENGFGVGFVCLSSAAIFEVFKVGCFVHFWRNDRGVYALSDAVSYSHCAMCSTSTWWVEVLFGVATVSDSNAYRLTTLTTAASTTCACLLIFQYSLLRCHHSTCHASTLEHAVPSRIQHPFAPHGAFPACFRASSTRKKSHETAGTGVLAPNHGQPSRCRNVSAFHTKA